MKEIIADDHHLFMTTKSIYNISHPRQVIYYKAYEQYKGPTEIQRYLMNRYSFSVNQSTIYYSWYKIKKKMSEMTPREFMKLKYGDELINGRGIHKLMYEYAIYHLEMHIDHPTQTDRKRLDVKQKVRELKSKI